ncbi:hypothetical protein BBOV_II003730 [Babesia bovis T2Bo]|uniref:Uncharacterized protein n=1 Tax=Babesia bovis TaxID=5865 RepID=A7ATR7_BABBO|nr:hypothetical protein BBOV_II003730 [Babesia bovis T2Bo]EDO06328.1 hypothetical protein BBOV_II003730 [Babesia bovis T2Bo]|eukprot:XP_001609896.1 hypothetical protein [Babesia bovis T2Bo]
MSRAEASLESGSGFDEEISRFMSAVHGENLIELLRQKCAIGTAISETLTGSDAITFTQSLSYRKLWHSNFDESNYNVAPKRDCISADLYCVFHQQVCEDWQSLECALERSLRIFDIIPHRKALIHLTDPKVSCLNLLSLCLGLNNVLFIGLHNVPQSGSLPGPYLGLMNPGSRESFLAALLEFESLYNSKSGTMSHDSNSDFPDYDCNGRLAEISYLASEFDDLFNYILYDSDCYSNYTKPLLQRMYSNRVYGRLMLALFAPGRRDDYRNQKLPTILKRFNELLRIVCRMLNDIASSKMSVVKNEARNFGTMAVITLIYSYLYAILSVPFYLTPWYKVGENESCTCHVSLKCSNTDVDTDSICTEPSIPDDLSVTTSSSHLSMFELNSLPSQDHIGLLGVDFASAAADAACVESTRRRDVMMSYAVGILGNDCGWLGRCERYVDMIDNYKLSLCWYRRPFFSSCMMTNYKKVFPWLMLFHQSNVGPCGYAWFEWQGKTVESWSSIPLWRNNIPPAGGGSQSGGDCIRCLKRLVSLRVRDCVSFIFDLESEIKRGVRRQTST